MAVKSKYQKLLEQRANYNPLTGKCIGKLEWTPTRLPKGDLYQYDGGVPETLERVLAIALQLELPVGEWIGETSRKEKDVIGKVELNLLKSNITDETVHFKAFSYLAEDYPISERVLDESKQIGQLWIDDKSHPLHKAAVAEVGVFLDSLALLNVFGSPSMFEVSARVSRDEMRHIYTNRGLYIDLYGDFNKLPKSLENARFQTLDWILQDLKVSGLDKDFFFECSNQLMEKGKCPELSELTSGSQDIAPFEASNIDLY